MRLIGTMAAAVLLLAACAPTAQTPTPTATASQSRVIATTTYLADIGQQVAGDRITVESLVPVGTDPHSFHPTPADARRLADAQLVIVHGQGLEEGLSQVLVDLERESLVVEASAGLTPADRGDGHDDKGGEAHADEAEDKGDRHEVDMHYWLDPVLAITYVHNIRDGLKQLDPEGAAVYDRNAEAYIDQLEELDRWIRATVDRLPAERRLLVTDHESLTYFADRYGFRYVGTVMPTASPGADPSPRAVAELVEKIKETGAPAIFLELGHKRQLVERVAAEAGVKVAPELHTHSVSPPDGPAPSYLEMMRYNVKVIVEALGG